MKNNPLRALESLGQSVWLDYLGRGATKFGKLQQLIDQDGLSGVTSNPDTFEKAIGESHDYDAAIHTLAGRAERCGAFPSHLRSHPRHRWLCEP